MQVVNVFICRSDRQSAFAQGFLSNKLILAGVAAEIALIATIVYTPWGNAIFGTAPIPVTTWLFILPFAIVMLVLEELRKWFVRSRNNTPVPPVANILTSGSGNTTAPPG
jgi:sodium/potassium-transporting ATPase subunit alpha